jgi:hypothetical protein
MDEKYVMANIKLPLRVMKTGKIEPLTHYIMLNIEPCDTLPEKKNLSGLNEEFNRKILSILKWDNDTTDKEDEPVETHDEDSTEDSDDDSVETTGEEESSSSSDEDEAMFSDQKNAFSITYKPMSKIIKNHTFKKYYKTPMQKTAKNKIAIL